MRYSVSPVDALPGKSVKFHWEESTNKIYGCIFYGKLKGNKRNISLLKKNKGKGKKKKSKKLCLYNNEKFVFYVCIHLFTYLHAHSYTHTCMCVYKCINHVSKIVLYMWIKWTFRVLWGLCLPKSPFHVHKSGY